MIYMKRTAPNDDAPGGNVPDPPKKPGNRKKK